MKAKKVYEAFRRGDDPLSSMDIGIRKISQLGPLKNRPIHILRKGNQEPQTSRGYMIWKLLNFINEKNKKGEPVGYADCVKFYYHKLKNQPGRTTISIGVRSSLNRYIDRDENKKYILNWEGKQYLKNYSFFDDKRETLEEAVNFERGRDPKAALGIGAWQRGYIIDKEPADFVKDRIKLSYYRIKFNEDERWNFSKKEFNPDEVYQTEIEPDMEKRLDPLPIVTFKYYKDTDGLPGLFGDWSEDFPFTKTPFIANCLEEDDRTFLIEPEGYNYARYTTELI